MRRREFITLVGGAAATWPLATRAQQPGMPVIGFLASVSTNEEFFRQGLKEAGFVEGENVSILYRFAEKIDGLTVLADDLARRRVTVIAALGHTPAFAAKTATTTAKRLQLLCELVPATSRMAVLVDPGSPTVVETTLRDLEPAARAMGLQMQVLNVSNSQEINAAFATFMRERPDALFVNTGPLFTARRVQLATQAARHMLPMTSGNRQITEAGGLMSYGASITDAYRQVGVYAGRILKGEKPEDLPVVQSSKFELVINAQTAKILDLTVPPSLLARADEVIE
jgi:putative tryptophan/tyrosine transport system substrate-binding protein